jgi:Ribbon-helix-helix protein, copG family
VLVARSVTLKVRMSAAEVERLDELARARGTTRSETLRSVLDAEPAGRMELGEALGLLDAAARRGNVPAITAVLRLLERRPVASDEFADFVVPGDELAERRRPR